MATREATVRDGAFDVVLLAGPRLPIWPSVGARALSILCSDMGLSVGLFGGPSLNVKGVLPAETGTGALVIIEDSQQRIHRIQARSVVKFSPAQEMPDAFEGCHLEGVLPLSTIERLNHASSSPLRREFWEPATVILGTSNRALRLGSDLLEMGVPRVMCLESFAQWGAKRIHGWEVERRRFESLGGKIHEGEAVSLVPSTPMRWTFRWRAQREQSLEVGRVIAAGPYSNVPLVREYPPGSLLFEFTQLASEALLDDVNGWTIEQERARWLGGKISRALMQTALPSAEHAEQREGLNRLLAKTKARLKRFLSHFDQPFVPAWDGKWMSVRDMKVLRAFHGVPRVVQDQRLVASIECVEEISCTICQSVCPESAITRDRQLNEQLCTACGVCVVSCPSRAIVMLNEGASRASGQIVFPWRGPRGHSGAERYAWCEGEYATLVNRRGEELGRARVSGVTTATRPGADVVPGELVQVEVPTHLVWEARAIRPKPAAAVEDQLSLSEPEFFEGKVDVTIEGEKRLVREGTTVASALLASGRARGLDVLHCPDASCRRCFINVDGVRKLACQEKIHRGMAITGIGTTIGEVAPPVAADLLCPCLEISRTQVVDVIRQGRLTSPEAILAATHVGEGTCHGQVCMQGLQRILVQEGVKDAAQFVDWRFPWTDWNLQ